MCLDFAYCDRTDDEIREVIIENPHPPLDEVFVGHLSASAVDLIQN